MEESFVEEVSIDGMWRLLSGGMPEFDSGLRWRRTSSVALRPEPFGALTYHFSNRTLTFLKSRTLVDVVEALASHPSAAAALAACGVTEVQRPMYLRALAGLARSQMIEVAA